MAKKKITHKKASPAKSECCSDECKCSTWWRYLISEVAFYAFIYLFLVYLGVANQGLWYKTFFLWALGNISIVFCPVLNKCLCK